MFILVLILIQKWILKKLSFVPLVTFEFSQYKRNTNKQIVCPWFMSSISKKYGETDRVRQSPIYHILIYGRSVIEYFQICSIENINYRLFLHFYVCAYLCIQLLKNPYNSKSKTNTQTYKIKPVILIQAKKKATAKRGNDALYKCEIKQINLSILISGGKERKEHS